MKACPEKGWGGPTDSPLLPQSASEPAEEKPAQKCLRPENSLPRLLPAAEKQTHQEHIKSSLPSHHLAPARPGACPGTREAYSLFILWGVWINANTNCISNSELSCSQPSPKQQPR